MRLFIFINVYQQSIDVLGDVRLNVDDDYYNGSLDRNGDLLV